MAAALHVDAASALPYQVPVVSGPLVVDPAANVHVSGDEVVKLSTMNQQLPVPLACSASAMLVPSAHTATLTADGDCVLVTDTWCS